MYSSQYLERKNERGLLAHQFFIYLIFKYFVKFCSIIGFFLFYIFFITHFLLQFKVYIFYVDNMSVRLSALKCFDE